LSFTVSSHPYSSVTTGATLAENRPLAALIRLDSALELALHFAGRPPAGAGVPRNQAATVWQTVRLLRP
jgi:hypothetical protein